MRARALGSTSRLCTTLPVAWGLSLLALGCSSTNTTGSGGASGTSVTNGATATPAAASGSTSASSSSAGAGGNAPTGTPTFVVAGYDLRRAISTDGTNWQHDISDPPDPNGLDNIGDGIAFGRGLVAVVAHSGLVTSHDGTTWNKVGAPLPQQWPGLGGGKIVFTGDAFLAVAGSDSYASTDGVTWTKSSSAAGATHWNGLAHGGGHFVSVGDSNSAGGDRKASEDGVTWHDYVEGGTAYRALAYGHGVFVAVGDQGLIKTTTDGVTWQDHSNPSLGDIGNLAFGNSTFLFCAGSKCQTSDDGATWIPHDATSPPNGPMAFGKGLFFSITWESNIWTSSNGFAWNKVWSGDPGTPALNSVGFGDLGP